MPDNWYNLIETQLLKTIQADSWLGTAGTNIVTIEAKLRPGPRSYYDHELPAISVKLLGRKRQEHNTLGEFDKWFTFVAFMLKRGGDLDAVVNDIQQIASALEDLLESQYNASNDLVGLGTHADIRGGPVVEIGGSVIDYTAATELNYTVVATLDGTVEIVTT